MVGSSVLEKMPDLVPDFSHISGQLTKITLNEDINLKNIRNYQKIIKVMIDRRVPKDAVIISMGPVSVMDLAGFVASTYRGGIRLISVPMTPLAQISRSVGGIYGLNFSNSTNTIAARYFPVEAYLDSIAFERADREEIKDFLIELIRLGAIRDFSVLNMLESFGDIDVLRRYENLKRLTVKALNIAPLLNTVKNDESDPNSFGNTLGSALFQICKNPVRYYRVMALSMILESFIADRSGIKTREVMDKLRRLMDMYSLNGVRLKDIGQENLLRFLRENYPGETGFPVSIPWITGESGMLSISFDRVFSAMRNYAETYEFST